MGNLHDPSPHIDTALVRCHSAPPLEGICQLEVLLRTSNNPVEQGVVASYLSRFCHKQGLNALAEDYRKLAQARADATRDRGLHLTATTNNILVEFRDVMRWHKENKDRWHLLGARAEGLLELLNSTKDEKQDRVSFRPLRDYAGFLAAYIRLQIGDRDYEKWRSAHQILEHQSSPVAGADHSYLAGCAALLEKEWRRARDGFAAAGMVFQGLRYKDSAARAYLATALCAFNQNDVAGTVRYLFAGIPLLNTAGDFGPRMVQPPNDLLQMVEERWRMKKIRKVLESESERIVDIWRAFPDEPSISIRGRDMLSQLGLPRQIVEEFALTRGAGVGASRAERERMVQIPEPDKVPSSPLPKYILTTAGGIVELDATELMNLRKVRRSDYYVRIDLTKNVLWIRSTGPIEVPPIPLRMLAVLVQFPEVVVPYEFFYVTFSKKIKTEAYSRHEATNTNQVQAWKADLHSALPRRSRLRKDLNNHIKAVWGEGYRFTPSEDYRIISFPKEKAALLYRAQSGRSKLEFRDGRLRYPRRRQPEGS